jgi:hypothetical protein
MQHSFIFHAAGNTFVYSARNKSERRLQYCMQNKRIACTAVHVWQYRWENFFI